MENLVNFGTFASAADLGNEKLMLIKRRRGMALGAIFSFFCTRSYTFWEVMVNFGPFASAADLGN